MDCGSGEEEVMKVDERRRAEECGDVVQVQGVRWGLKRREWSLPWIGHTT